MASKSHSARDLIAVEEKINNSPEELAQFVKSPAEYLRKSGIVLSEEHQRDLTETLREMKLGPRQFDQITSLKKPRVGIGISIRIRF